MAHYLNMGKFKTGGAGVSLSLSQRVDLTIQNMTINPNCEKFFTPSPDFTTNNSQTPKPTKESNNKDISSSSPCSLFPSSSSGIPSSNNSRSNSISEVCKEDDNERNSPSPSIGESDYYSQGHSSSLNDLDVDEDLTAQCITIIKQRKKKQEAEANKNAACLLAQEREEEERKAAALAKKREKKRMKRKAKASSKTGGQNDEKETSPDLMQRSVEDRDQDKWRNRSDRSTSEPPTPTSNSQKNSCFNPTTSIITSPTVSVSISLPSSTPLSTVVTTSTVLSSSTTSNGSKKSVPPISSSTISTAMTTTVSSCSSNKKKRGRTKELSPPVPVQAPNSETVVTNPPKQPNSSTSDHSVMNKSSMSSASLPTQQQQSKTTVPVEVPNPPLVSSITNSYTTNSAPSVQQSTLDKKREKHRGKKQAIRSTKKTSNSISEDAPPTSKEDKSKTASPNVSNYSDLISDADWGSGFQDNFSEFDYSTWYAFTGNGSGDHPLQEVQQWKTVPKRKVSIPVQKKDIGKVIGQLGATVKALRSHTGAHIDIEDLKEGTDAQERCVHIRGQPEAVAKARDLIDELISGKLTSKDVASLASPKRMPLLAPANSTVPTAGKGMASTPTGTAKSIACTQQSKPLPIRKTHAVPAKTSGSSSNTNNTLANRIGGQVPWVVTSTKEEMNFASVAAAGVVPSKKTNSGLSSTNNEEDEPLYDSFPTITESINRPTASTICYQTNGNISTTSTSIAGSVGSFGRVHNPEQSSTYTVPRVYSQSFASQQESTKGFARAPGSERHQRLTGTPEHSPQLSQTILDSSFPPTSSSTSPHSSDRGSAKSSLVSCSGEFLAARQLHLPVEELSCGASAHQARDGSSPMDPSLQLSQLTQQGSDSITDVYGNVAGCSQFHQSSPVAQTPTSSYVQQLMQCDALNSSVHQLPRVLSALNPQAQSFSPSLGSVARCSTPPELRGLPRVTSDLNPSASTFQPQRISAVSPVDPLAYQASLLAGRLLSQQLPERFLPATNNAAVAIASSLYGMAGGLHQQSFSNTLAENPVAPSNFVSDHRHHVPSPSASPSAQGFLSSLKPIGSERRIHSSASPVGQTSSIPSKSPIPAPSATPFQQDPLWNPHPVSNSTMWGAPGTPFTVGGGNSQASTLGTTVPNNVAGWTQPSWQRNWGTINTAPGTQQHPHSAADWS